MPSNITPESKRFDRVSVKITSRRLAESVGIKRFTVKIPYYKAVKVLPTQHHKFIRTRVDNMANE